MISISGIPLPDDLAWSDELEWQGYKHRVKPNLSGGVTITGGEVRGNAGRPLTLTSDYAWVSRTTMLSLLQLLASPGPYNVILHDGREFLVVCAETGIVAPQLLEDPKPSDSTLHKLTLYFIIIQ